MTSPKTGVAALRLREAPEAKRRPRSRAFSSARLCQDVEPASSSLTEEEAKFRT